MDERTKSRGLLDCINPKAMSKIEVCSEPVLVPLVQAGLLLVARGMLNVVLVRAPVFPED